MPLHPLACTITPQTQACLRARVARQLLGMSQYLKADRLQQTPVKHSTYASGLLSLKTETTNLFDHLRQKHTIEYNQAMKPHTSSTGNVKLAQASITGAPASCKFP